MDTLKVAAVLAAHELVNSRTKQLEEAMNNYTALVDNLSEEEYWEFTNNLKVVVLDAG